MKHNKIITTEIYGSADITGHLPNFITIQSYKQYSKYDQPLIRIYGDKNTANFKELIAKSSWEEF